MRLNSKVSLPCRILACHVRDSRFIASLDYATLSHHNRWPKRACLAAQSPRTSRIILRGTALGSENDRDWVVASAREIPNVGTCHLVSVCEEGVCKSQERFHHWGSLRAPYVKGSMEGGVFRHRCLVAPQT